MPSAITSKTECRQLCGHLNGNCYTWTGYLYSYQSLYDPPFCPQTKDRNTDKCCLMILGVYNLWMTSDSPIPQTRKAHQYRPHFLPQYLTVGYRHQAQLHTKQCKQSLQHKLDVPSVGLLSGAQSNLILSHFHQIETCASKNAHIISHQRSNLLWVPTGPACPHGINICAVVDR